MKRRMAMVIVGGRLFAVTSGASANHDRNPDPTRCDTWYRQGHLRDPEIRDSHDHPSNSDIVLGDPANTVIHSHQGHHVIRNDYGYIEIVGGNAYRGPHPGGPSFPGQGGYVQAEVDPAEDSPDADANLAFFGPDVDRPPTDGDVANWAQGSYGRACVDAYGQRADQQTREP